MKKERICKVWLQKATPLNKSMTRSVSKPDFEVACFLAPREGLELQASVVPSYDWKHSVTALAVE